MTRCVRCAASLMDLSLIPVIQKRFAGRFENKAAFELSTDGSTLIWRFFDKSEYHDSRIAGPQTAAVFWHRSIHDIAARVKDAGFRSTDFVDGLLKSPVRSRTDSLRN
jgi:hypothetical protein